MILSQISNKFHRFQQITNQGKVNVQRKANGIKRLYSDFARHVCIFVYIYVFFFFAGYKYPIFCKKTLQSLHEHKSGFQVLVKITGFTSLKTLNKSTASVLIFLMYRDKPVFF